MRCDKTHIMHLSPSSLRSSEIRSGTSKDIAEGRKSKRYHKERRRGSINDELKSSPASLNFGATNCSYLHVMLLYHPNPLHAVPPRANFPDAVTPMGFRLMQPISKSLSSYITYTIYQLKFVVLLYCSTCTLYNLKRCLASPLIPELISRMSISGASCSRGRIDNTLTIKVSSPELPSCYCLANRPKSSTKTPTRVGRIPTPRSNPQQLISVKA